MSEINMKSDRKNNAKLTFFVTLITLFLTKEITYVAVGN